MRIKSSTRGGMFMQIQEFTERVGGIEPTEVEYKRIEEMYYAFDGDKDLILSNIPQQYLEHYGISLCGYVDHAIVQMQAVGDSANAEVPLVVLNTPGFDLPQTGDNGVWMYGVAGGPLMLAAALVVLCAFKKKEKKQAA